MFNGRLSVIALIAVMACAAMTGLATAKAEEEKSPLEGTWSVVSMADKGETLPESVVRNARFVFSGNKLTVRIREKVIVQTEFTIDATQSPPTIRMVYGGKSTAGIWQLEGDDLRICLGNSVDQIPTEFASQANSPNRMLVVLKRGDLVPRGWPLLVLGADGGARRQLAEFPRDMAIGSPDWSPDGTRIAFDAWRLARGETYVQARVFVVNVDGTGLKEIAAGAMPSWSPDGQRITFCQYRPNRGVWVMDADGTNQQLIDPDGWGSDWSPVGNEIAYGNYPAGYRAGANICIVDLDTGKRRQLLQAQRYRSIYWNLSWSPDGKYICFDGIRRGGAEEIAIVSTEGDERGFRVLLSREKDKQFKAIRHIVAWDGNADRILVSMRGPGDKLPQLYTLDPKGERPPQRVPGQDPKRLNGDMAWAPDGKMLVVASQEK